MGTLEKYLQIGMGIAYFVSIVIGSTYILAFMRSDIESLKVESKDMKADISELRKVSGNDKEIIIMLKTKLDSMEKTLDRIDKKLDQKELSR